MYCMEFLRQAFCEEDSENFCYYREERENLLSAYEQYLEAVTVYYYLICNKVYIGLDEETQEEIKQQMMNIASFLPQGL